MGPYVLLRAASVWLVCGGRNQCLCINRVHRCQATETTPVSLSKLDVGGQGKRRKSKET